MDQFLDLWRSYQFKYYSVNNAGLVYLNVWDRHLEQSKVCEQTLNQRAFQKPEGIEESVLDMLEMEQLHRAIVNLPEV